MNVTTRGQLAGPAAARVQSSSSSSPPSWRCNNRGRLHRDDKDCNAGSPPSSPIIDTPEKRMTFERKRNALQLQDSQITTQPTPSRAASSHRRPQSKRQGPSYVSESASPLANRQNVVNWWDSFFARAASLVILVSPTPSHTNLTTIQEESVGTIDGNEQNWSPFTEDENFQMIDGASNPEQQSQNFSSSTSNPSERIPETPLNLPSSPPLPRLTANNLSLLNSTSGSNLSSPASSHAEIAASIRSLPSYATHRISRLVLRSRINALQHAAVESRLAATHGDLSAAQSYARQSAAREEAWKGFFFALLLLCLAYAVWCWYHSVEFEYINSCRRAWYGL